ncbi:MAG: right-handed parallel beta-helix repeat-containing protein, partial [Candidatus Cloacimonetes bacterium]|nr:right-handed parallel beta-helix repeat-containing protein [Candidatus Cloacimonadota bacterium]
MKHFLFVLLLLCGISQLLAIDVSGSQSGTWTPENNPYQVVGSITVPSGSNLDIQPGVLVHIMGNYQITIAGTMHANGTPTDSIRFVNMQANPTALWTGLRFENTTVLSQLSYVYLEYATYGIRCMNAPLNISHNRINHCEKGMELYAIGAATPNHVLVEYNIIENCIQNGILITQQSAATINCNEIRYNGTGAQFRAAIQLANQSAGGSCNPIINNNHIHHNLKQGISAWDVSSSGAINPYILNNTIEYNYTGIYLLQTSGYVADNQINHNFIPGDMNSGAGVMVSGITSEPYFERNTITGNYTGFFITNNAKPILGDLSIYHAWAQGENIITDNIDANGILHSVFCSAYPNAANIIMAENNNWGVNDAAEIAIGINDHNDNAALPTVDFDPILSNITPTSVFGSYVYVGQSEITAARLELISTATGAVLHTFPLTSPIINITAPIVETFYAMIVLTRANGSLVYGCTGGFLAPQVFSPGDLIPVDVGTIMVGDDPPPRYELNGEIIMDDDLALHPIMHGFALYGWRSMDLVYVSGDYLYLKRNIRRTQAGELVTELPLGTVYKKYLNIVAGDTWSQTEVKPLTGQVVMSTVRVDACVSAPGMSSFKLITRTNTAGDVADKMIVDFGDPILFTYGNSYLTSRETIQHIGDPEPLA